MGPSNGVHVVGLNKCQIFGQHAVRSISFGWHAIWSTEISVKLGSFIPVEHQQLTCDDDPDGELDDAVRLCRRDGDVVPTFLFRVEEHRAAVRLGPVFAVVVLVALVMSENYQKWLSQFWEMAAIVRQKCVNQCEHVWSNLNWIGIFCGSFTLLPRAQIGFLQCCKMPLNLSCKLK